MQRWYRLITCVVLGTFLLASTACQERVVYTSPAISGGQTYSGSTSSGIDQEHFDLQTAIGLLRTNKVRDAQSLEAAINDSGSGINNLDLDNDGQIDYVGIQESVSGSERHLAFMCCPSSKQGEPVNIANVTIRDDGQQVYVGGGYTSIFNGYNGAYYSYYVPRSSFADAMFLAWLLTPSRPYYAYHPYGYGWAPRPVYAPTVLRSTRTTYTTQTRVSPVPRVAPPANYTKQAAVKMPSSLASKPAGSGLSGTAGQMRDFKVNTSPKPAASAFGASSPKPASSGWGGGGSAFKPSVAPASKPASSGWGSAGSAFKPSSSPKPSSGGWGGGGSTFKSSGGFGSSRSSGGFGGGRRK